MKLKVKIVLTNDAGEGFMGIGLVWLLRRIKRLKSIRRAAADMGMSYAKALKIINRLEENLEEKVILRKRGGRARGGAELTLFAEKFLLEYERFQRMVSDHAAERFVNFKRKMKSSACENRKKEAGMRKKALIAALVAAALALPAGWSRASDDWEWWIETPVTVKLTPEVKGEIIGLFRFKNDMKDFYYRSFIVGPYYSFASWVEAGAQYWYKESRASLAADWVTANIAVARLNFKYSPDSWITLKENNRLEFDFSIDRFLLRVKPIAEFPLAWAGLDPVKLFLDNEFFLAFDYADDRDTFSENRATAGTEIKIAGPAAVGVGYRNRGVKAAATGSWTFSNILLTQIKLSF